MCRNSLLLHRMKNSPAAVSHPSAADPAIMPTTAAASQGMLLNRPVTASPWLPKEATYSGIQFCNR